MGEPEASKNGTRDHVPGDYKGILDPAEAKKRGKKRSRFKKGESGNPVGRPKGSFSIATQLRKTLQELRGNRPKFVLAVEAWVDAAITGDRDYNAAPLKLMLEYLIGKPIQTIITNAGSRDGYEDLPTEERLRIAGAKLTRPRKSKAAPRRGGDGES